jgi:hypothetical protein
MLNMDKGSVHKSEYPGTRRKIKMIQLTLIADSFIYVFSAIKLYNIIVILLFLRHRNLVNRSCVKNRDGYETNVPRRYIFVFNSKLGRLVFNQPCCCWRYAGHLRGLLFFFFPTAPVIGRDPRKKCCLRRLRLPDKCIGANTYVTVVPKNKCYARGSNRMLTNNDVCKQVLVSSASLRGQHKSLLSSILIVSNFMGRWRAGGEICLWGS